MIIQELKDWLDTHRAYIIGGSLFGLGFLLLLVFFIGSDETDNEMIDDQPQIAFAKGTESFTMPAEPMTVNQTQVKPIQAETCMVDIKGAVKEPMLYKVSEGERVYDVIERAGGLLDNADRNRINFSLKVSDQMVIYIPKQGEGIPDALSGTVDAGTQTGGTANSSQSDTINVNTASKEELMTVSGIGEKKAQDIIDYRETNGPFQKIDDLIDVSGIGEKTLEKLCEQLAV